MITPEYCRTMARYNRWMNERLYGLCAGLSDEVRKEDRGAPFHSIHGTLNHALLADTLWMGRFLGEPERFFAETGPIRSLDQELHADFGRLRRARTAMDDEVDAWAAAITGEGLAGELVFTSVVSPATRTLPLWFAVVHFFNHQTHHRGQLTTLIEQTGCDIGVTDLLVVPGGPLAPAS
ncbi:MAG: hypothetical protein K0Q72_2045 [Armatimonadetes bacterium]|jgi:uncharacterized damage-inducible protein DinB|nr:hypothetical protein [Armatimonadota bacterium]